MYEYNKGNYIYYGDRYCGSPIKGIKTISNDEYKYWDKIEKEIKKANSNK